MNAPHAKLNRTALWTAVSTIASRASAHQNPKNPDAARQLSNLPDTLAVRVSANGATLCLTEYRQVARSAATETLHGLSDSAIVTEFTLADQSGRRFHAIRRGFAAQ
jgi:hypothetical protein